MSTKINVRSPFYVNITEPSVPTPTFTCAIANIQGLSIDQQGQIQLPVLSYGIIDTITSSDPDFSNGKFPTESTDTSRTLTVRIFIPEGFSNVDDGYIDCDKTVTQPAYTPSDPVAPSCTGGPTSTGSIPAQSLDVGGDSTSINLSSYFTQGNVAIAGYNIYNVDANLVNATVNGNTLSLSSNTIGGSTTIQISAYDNETNSCTATQSVSVTVSNPTTNFDCTIANLVGGSIAQDGTITKPTSFVRIDAIKDTSGGSTITSYPANNTGSDRSVTLYFDLTAPAGYANSGSTIECSKTFTQPAGLPEFTCEVANLSGQKISSKGSILIGTAQYGTVQSFSPIGFDPVSVDTPRQVTFTVTVPSGYSNSGTIDCVKTITQPAEISTCGTHGFYISAPKTSVSGFCDSLYRTSTPITSTSSSIATQLGARVCRRNSPIDGQSFYYAISTSIVDVGAGTGQFEWIQVDSNGIVEDVGIAQCYGSGISQSGSY